MSSSPAGSAAASSSARELTAHALARIEALNPAVNAFVAVDGERALEQAAAVDQIVATGGDPGPLAGVPIGVKDLEDAAGYRTTHGSPLLADAPAAVHDSALVARLRAAGCVVVGKTNTPEFGWSANTDQRPVRAHPQPLEPRPQRRRVVGRVGGGPGRRHGAPGHRVPTAAARSASPRRAAGCRG